MAGPASSAARADETQGAAPQAGTLAPLREAARPPGDGAAGEQGGPRWTAEGTLLAVERAGADGAPAVEVVDIARRLRMVIPGSAPRLAPDGQRLVVERAVVPAGAAESALPAGRRLVVIELPSGRELALPGVLPPGEAPMWAADGQRLLSTLAFDAGGPSEVFLLDLRGESPQLHQVSEGSGRKGRWLGRGDRVTFEGRERDGRPVLLLRDQGGRGKVRRFWTDDPIEPAPRFDPERIS